MLYRGSFRSTGRGFTIVELLVVIVVIAILAAITIVSYNGITNSAKESIVKSDLRNGVTQLQLVKLQTGSFPSDDSSLKRAASTNFYYRHDSSAGTFCLSATTDGLAGKSFYVTEAGSIEEGSCLEAATTMQTFTSAHCSALPVYTGSNSDAITSLTDSRGASRTYEVAKLADGKCWMLTNLKLGSTSSTTTLTPSDTNIGSNFTLPQVTSSSGINYDNPSTVNNNAVRVDGPVPSDTGSGSTNYGYLYSWPAATAGETMASKPAGSGNAQYSICPAGWRLPTGGLSDEFAALDIAFGGTGTFDHSNGPSHAMWAYTGPFKGVLSGAKGESWINIGLSGILWSSTTGEEGVDVPSDSAYGSVFGNGSTIPSSERYRHQGHAVRCILA